MKEKIVIIGASTGGPSLIKELLQSIQTLSYTIVIAQHMKEEVLPFFISELQSNCSHLNIVSTPYSVDFRTPSVIICAHSSIFVKRGNSVALQSDNEGQNFTPDINKLLFSFNPLASAFDATVIIMTGMGRDGVLGAKELKSQGVKIFAQDEKSSPLYGMPKAAYESGIVDRVQSFAEIKNYLKGENGTI